MSADFIEKVYDTLQGNLIADTCLPDVENLFADGKPCDRLYEEVLDAYARLCCRLSTIDEDKDVEIIINSMLSICRHLGYAMYHYGAKFGIRE